MDEQKAVSEAQKRAHRKYMEKFVEIKVRVTPEKRTAIQEHAQTMGESATTFINRAIDHQISQDCGKGPSEARGGPLDAGVISFSEAYKCAIGAPEAAGEGSHDSVARAAPTQPQRDGVVRTPEGGDRG